MSYYNKVTFSELKGKVLVEIRAKDDNIHFVTSEGESFNMYHDQDCCERVRIESIVGDLKDLLGNPLMLAEESSNAQNPEYKGNYYESHTWTFYKLATIKGYVDIRWLGESNGYYSESVSLYKSQNPQYSKEEIFELIQKNGLNSKVINSYKDQEESKEEEVSVSCDWYEKAEAMKNQQIKDSETKELYNKKKTRFNL